MSKTLGFLAFLLFAASIPAANWMIGNVGTICPPDSPCLIPVGFGLFAPSGVLLVGIALVLRDIVHEKLGFPWAVSAIAVGSILSVWLAPPTLAVASFAAFLLSEIADLLVYTPLRKKRLVLAVALSGLVGSIIDSAIFLWLAFGSLEHVEGQVVGKMWMSLAAAIVLVIIRRFKAVKA